VCFDGLPDVFLKNFIRHPETAPGIQFPFVKVETVMAGQVTPGPTGLGHEMECGKIAGRHEENSCNQLREKKG
jgi:hypothetical protein